MEACIRAQGLTTQLPLMLILVVQIYDRLQQMSAAIPAVGNKDGSYLTAFSSGGLQYVPQRMSMPCACRFPAEAKHSHALPPLTRLEA